MDDPKVRATGNRVFVRLLDPEEKRKFEGSAIHQMAEVHRLKELILAEVLSVGPKVYDVTKGNTVLLPGTYVSRQEARYTFIEEPEIEAVVE